MKKHKHNYAVFDITNGFRHTEYTLCVYAIQALQRILWEQPNMKHKLQVKQRGFSV